MKTSMLSTITSGVALAMCADQQQELEKSMARILFAGEQVTGTGGEVKGFDSFAVNADKEEGQMLFDALAGGGHEVAWMRTNRVARHFPETIEALQAYDVVILSDVGSNTLLFHPDMLANCNRHPNRLRLLADYVREGGGLIMVGGWMSFAGIGGLLGRGFFWSPNAQ